MPTTLQLTAMKKPISTDAAEFGELTVCNEWLTQPAMLRAHMATEGYIYLKNVACHAPRTHGYRGLHLPQKRP